MLKTVLASIVGTGGGAAALWWMVNRTYQINGQGWLERQDFPFNSVWLVGGVGAVIGLFLGLIRHRRNTKLREELAAVTDAGEAVAETSEFEHPTMPLFANVHSIENRIRRTQDGLRIEAFDLTTVSSSDDGTKYTRRTVILLPAEGLADFKLNAKTAGFRFLAWIGADGVTFDSAAGKTPEDQGAIEAFGGMYQLSVHDTTDLAAGTPDVFTEGDDAARRAFSLRVLKWLAKRPGWSMESHGGHLALWRGSNVPGARQRLNMMSEAVAVRGLLLNPDTIVPPRRGTDRSRQSARFQGALLGGVLGLFASFFIGAIATMAVLFNHKAELGSRPTFELLIFPAILVAGAALGTFIGSRLPIKKPLLQKPKDPKLEKRVGCAVLFGLFGGFMGGAATGAILGIALDLGMDQHVIRMTLFFGGAGVGAITGPVVCGVLAKKILTRFQREKA